MHIVRQKRIRRAGLAILCAAALFATTLLPAPPAGVHARPLLAVEAFTPVSGTDTTGGIPLPLTSLDLAGLSLSDDTRQGVDGVWPASGTYDEALYVEYAFNPALPAGSIVSGVTLTHEFQGSGTLGEAKLEVFETETGTWYDEALRLPGGEGADTSQEVDVSSYIDSALDLGGLRVRFLAYHADPAAALTTAHDLLRLRVEYEAPTPPDTPTPAGSMTGSATGTETPTGTPAPSHTATQTPSGSPTASETSSATPSLTPSETATATQTPVPEVVLINEAVTDPQQDWSDSAGGDAAPFSAFPGAGTVSDTDEWIELYNAGPGPINLQASGGWSLVMNDSSPAALNFASPASWGTAVFVFSSCGSLTSFQPGEFLVVGNPPGAMNNDVYLQLQGPLAPADDVEIGDDPENDNTLPPAPSDGAPDGGTSDGNASSPLDEAVARLPNASDTGVDVDDFTRRAASPGYSSDLAAPPPAVLCPTPTPTPTVTPTLTPTTFPARALVINEVMWMGTAADANDEWIEIYNTTGLSVDLSRWTLTLDDGLPPDDTVINLAGTLAPGGYFLLERTDGNTVSDLPAPPCAGQIYAGSLPNGGAVLNLRDPSFTSIDTANADGGPWPGGLDSPRASMERHHPGPDTDGSWSTNYGHVVAGRDAQGGPIRGTPCAANSNLVPTPPPTPFARVGTVRLNEVLPNPSADWSIYYPGGPAPYEYVEMVNLGSEPVDISYWMIDDQPGGSRPFVLWPGAMIDPGDYWCLGARAMGLSFNDRSDSVRLLYPDGSVVDEVSWETTRRDDMSLSRDPPGSGQWNLDWQPTPCMGNTRHAVGSRYGPKPTPIVAGVRAARTWSDGAWVTVVGQVIGPHPLFGARVVYVQDESRRGIAVYLGRGTWPPMVVGQRLTAAGYLRTRNGERELYVRNAWLYSLGEVGEPPEPLPIRTGDAGDEYEGTLVAVSGRVVRLESTAFWIDDGSGMARIFFKSTTGVTRPKVRRGQIWTAIGILSEYTTRTSRARGFRIMVRFAGEVFQMGGAGAAVDLVPTLTSLPEESETPTLIPEETLTPSPAP